MRRYRKQLIEWLFKHSQRVYTSLFKSYDPWDISVNELLSYATESFGFHLGTFLHKHNFELIPKVERHDCYHVLTGYGTTIENEIALQCLCYGNGKRSLYLYGAVILGIIILPDYYTYYYKSYCIGKKANAFHHYNYKSLLRVSIKDFRAAIFSNHILKTLHFQYQ